MDDDAMPCPAIVWHISRAATRRQGWWGERRCVSEGQTKELMWIWKGYEQFGEATDPALCLGI